MEETEPSEISVPGLDTLNLAELGLTCIEDQMDVEEATPEDEFSSGELKEEIKKRMGPNFDEGCFDSALHFYRVYKKKLHSWKIIS